MQSLAPTVLKLPIESKALFDTACAGGIACGNGFVIAGKEDLVLFRRQVCAGGQMELFAVHVADVDLLRRAGGRRVGGVQLAVRHKVLGAHGEVLAVAANGDGALQVGAVDVHLCVPQDAQGLLVGVAVLVVDPAGDDAHLGQDSVQEDVAGGGAGAVVAHL